MAPFGVLTIKVQPLPSYPAPLGNKDGEMAPFGVLTIKVQPLPSYPAPHGNEDGEMAPSREKHVFHKSLWVQLVIQGEMAPSVTVRWPPLHGEMAPGLR